jgi:hypothetical protein
MRQVVAECEDRYRLEDKVLVDVENLGGVPVGIKAECGSEKNIAFVAAIPLTKAYRSLRVGLTPVPGYTLKAVVTWAKNDLALSTTSSR